MQKLIYILLIATILCMASASWSQNLVPNPSFEELDSCPSGVNQFEAAREWYNPTMASPDLMATCAVGTNAHVPDNSAGFQYAHSGENYALIGLRDLSRNYYEYIAVRLEKSLEKDSTYCVSLFASAADYWYAYSDALAVFFSVDSVFSSSTTRLQKKPQFKNADYNYISDTTGWQEIFGYYRAQGGENYIVIGNFYSYDSTHSIGSIPYDYIGVYIDDVSIKKCTKPATENFMSLYPNPNRGTFWVQYGLEDSKTGRFKVFDTAGKLIYDSTLPAGERYKQIPLPPFSKGLYFWLYQVDGKKVQSGKMVVFQD